LPFKTIVWIFSLRKSYSWRHNALLNFYCSVCQSRIRCSLTRIKPNKPHGDYKPWVLFEHSKFLGWFYVTSYFSPHPPIFNEATYYTNYQPWSFDSSQCYFWKWTISIYFVVWKKFCFININLFQNQKYTTCWIMLVERKKSLEWVSFFWVGPTFHQNLTFGLSQISNYKLWLYGYSYYNYSYHVISFENKKTRWTTTNE
jgi:hypothetical protein